MSVNDSSREKKSYFEVIRRPVISRLFAASILNNIAIASYLIALSIIFYTRVPNTLFLGVVLSIPALASLLGPFTGHIVDAHRKKSIIMIVRVTDVFVFLALGFVIATNLPYLVLIFSILAFVIEINNSLRSQSIGTVYQLYIDRADDAIRLKSIQGVAFWVTHAIMPVVTGFLIAKEGDVFPFVLIAGLILPQVALYTSLRFKDNPSTLQVKTHFISSIRQSAGELKSLMKTRRTVRLMVLTPILHSFFITANYVLIVALIYRLGHFAINFGVIASVGIAGNALGSFLAGIIKPKRGSTIIVLFALTFLADVPVGLEPTFLVMIVFLTLGGTLYYIVSTQFDGLSLTLIPREHYGRITGIISLMTGISTVIGTVVLSAVALVVSPRIVYLISVSILTLVTASLLLSRSFRKAEVTPR